MAQCLNCYIKLDADQFSFSVRLVHALQDWDQVVIRKKAPKNADLKDESAVNAVGLPDAAVRTLLLHHLACCLTCCVPSHFLQARRAGVAIDTAKKCG